jgi:hypothetical protein
MAIASHYGLGITRATRIGPAGTTTTTTPTTTAPVFRRSPASVGTSLTIRTPPVGSSCVLPSGQQGQIWADGVCHPPTIATAPNMTINPSTPVPGTPVAAPSMPTLLPSNCTSTQTYIPPGAAFTSGPMAGQVTYTGACQDNPPSSNLPWIIGIGAVVLLVVLLVARR